MDTDRNNQISHVEIITFADLWSRPMPLIVYPDSVIPRYIGVKVDTQLSYEEMKNEIEGAATMLIGALDSNGDEEISQGEVVDGVKSLIRQAIQVVDQGGNSIDILDFGQFLIFWAYYLFFLRYFELEV